MGCPLGSPLPLPPSFPFPKLSPHPTSQPDNKEAQKTRKKKKKRREPVLGWSLWQPWQGIQLSLSQCLTHVIILSCRLNVVLTAVQQGLVEQGRGGSCRAPGPSCLILLYPDRGSTDEGGAELPMGETEDVSLQLGGISAQEAHSRDWPEAGLKLGHHTGPATRDVVSSMHESREFWLHQGQAGCGQLEPSWRREQAVGDGRGWSP